MCYKKGAQIRGSFRPRTEVSWGLAYFWEGSWEEREFVGCGERPDAEEARQGVQYSGSHVISRGTGSTLSSLLSPRASFLYYTVIVKSHASNFNGNIGTYHALKVQQKKKKKRRSEEEEEKKKTRDSIFTIFTLMLG